MNKHIHTLPDGTKATRNSKNRIYTHVIIGRHNLVAARANVSSAACVAMHMRSFRHYAALANTPVGQSYDGSKYGIVTAKDQAEGAAVVAQYKTAEAYAQAMIAKAVGSIGAGDEGPWQVLQWSMSAASAKKAVGGWAVWYSSVRVEPVAA